MLQTNSGVLFACSVPRALQPAIMAPTKSNPRRILRDNGEISITTTEIPASPQTPTKRNSERLASQKRKDDIVSKMAEIFEDVAPMESSSVVAVPVADDDLQMPECQDEPLPGERGGDGGGGGSTRWWPATTSRLFSLP